MKQGKDSHKTAVIIGAGPSGITCATELLERSSYTPVILEMTEEIGGISKTVNYKGFRMDMGGHRFFSKSDEVSSWWLELMPLQGAPARDEQQKDASGAPLPRHDPDPETTDRVMLRRKRLSSILHLGHFFDYPLSFSKRTLFNFGPVRLAIMGVSYIRSRLLPIRPEKSLEDFVINRFGKKLYRTFFRDYTIKVWGVAPSNIPPDWGAQRIKGLSLAKALWHSVKRPFMSRDDLDQKKVETTLIANFYYPKFGPGQLWEQAAMRVQTKGGALHMNQCVTAVELSGKRILSVTAEDRTTGKREKYPGDVFVSTMPIRELVAAMGDAPPDEVREVAAGLTYRDFIVVGVLLQRLRVENHPAVRKEGTQLIPESWIYVQESAVTMARIQIYNNWSPYMVADADKVWLGLEYFCTERDEIWNMPDEELLRMAVKELGIIGFAEESDVLDGTVCRVPKAYPAYFGSYDRFHVVRDFLDSIENLYLIGRNGMHRYNNMDHSMLTAMHAARLIAGGAGDKRLIWNVNTEEEYHEEKGA